MDSSSLLTAAKNSGKKKVMKAPKIDLDIDALISGVTGGGPAHPAADDNDNLEDPDDEDLGAKVHGTNSTHLASHNRAKAREDTVDKLLTDYATKPKAEKKVRKKKKKRYPLYGLRKAIGCADVELHTAVLEGSLKVIRQTLRRQSKKNPNAVNEYDGKGRTALGLSIMAGREDIAETILSSSDVNPDIADQVTGMAPIHHAAHLGLKATVSKLLWRHCKIDIKDKNGTTALMMACGSGNAGMVDLLLEENADPDLTDKFKWNSLFYAAYGGSPKVVLMILEQGVNKKKKDRKKLMAIDWAEYMKHGEVAALLESFTMAMSTDKYRGAMG